MWTREEVEGFIHDHPIDRSWKDGYKVQGRLFSPTKRVVYSSGYGEDAHYEVRLLPNLRHCPQHTLLGVLDFMQQAVHSGDVTIWNHPDGDIRIMFTESVDPGP